MSTQPRSYSVTEIGESPAAALRQAREGGTVDITSRGQVVARLVPATEDPVLEPVGRFEIPTRTVKLKGKGLASDAIIEDRG